MEKEKYKENQARTKQKNGQMIILFPN